MVEIVNQKCVDGQIYSWCKECGKWADRPDTEIVPVSTATQMCITCMQTPENMGRIKTLKPVFMPSDRNNPDSPKQWFWFCSLCSHREPLLNNQLKRQYVNTEQKSFVKSLETRKKKSSIPDEDIKDLSGLGTITSLVYEKDEQYNG